MRKKNIPLPLGVPEGGDKIQPSKQTMSNVKIGKGGVIPTKRRIPSGMQKKSGGTFFYQKHHSYGMVWQSVRTALPFPNIKRRVALVFPVCE